MELRELRREDAPRMLEWMHDTSVVCYMGTDFASKTLEDCERFIISARNDHTYFHRAIVNEEDLYMGTVSLKHINSAKGYAEFAITVRKDAMGGGYAGFGMREILRYGLEELGLRQIYWCVSRQNERAIRFYAKNGYQKMEKLPEEEDIDLTDYSEEQIASFYWYLIERND